MVKLMLSEVNVTMFRIVDVKCVSVCMVNIIKPRKLGSSQSNRLQKRILLRS